MKRIDPRSRPGGGAQKALPSSSGSKSTTQKALPSTTTTTSQKALPSSQPKLLKALPAPSSTASTTKSTATATPGKKTLPKVKEGYKPFTPTQPAYKPFEPTASKQGYTPYQAPKSAAPSVVAGTGASVGAKKPAATAAAEPQIKSRTLSSGKVVASASSKPRPPPTQAQSKPLNLKPSSSYAASSVGVGGPLGAKAPSVHAPTSARPPAPASASKAGSVVGGGGAKKDFGGHIPGFAGAGPSKPATASRAPTVVGGGGGGGGKAPAGSKAGSVVGGPKFF